MEPPEKIALQCETLRVMLKENGLERTVQLMSVADRGDARKLIRDALATHAKLMMGELKESTHRRAVVATSVAMTRTPDVAQLSSAEGEKTSEQWLQWHIKALEGEFGPGSYVPVRTPDVAQSSLDPAEEARNLDAVADLSNCKDADRTAAYFSELNKK